MIVTTTKMTANPRDDSYHDMPSSMHIVVEPLIFHFNTGVFYALLTGKIVPRSFPAATLDTLLVYTTFLTGKILFWVHFQLLLSAPVEFTPLLTRQIGPGPFSATTFSTRRVYAITD